MLYRSPYLVEAGYGYVAQQISGDAQLVTNRKGGVATTVGMSMAPALWIVNFILIYTLNPDVAAAMPAYWTPIPPVVSSAIYASEHGQVPYADYRNAFPQGKTTTNPVCRWAVAISAPRLRAAGNASGLLAVSTGRRSTMNTTETVRRLPIHAVGLREVHLRPTWSIRSPSCATRPPVPPRGLQGELQNTPITAAAYRRRSGSSSGRRAAATASASRSRGDDPMGIRGALRNRRISSLVDDQLEMPSDMSGKTTSIAYRSASRADLAGD